MPFTLASFLIGTSYKQRGALYGSIVVVIAAMVFLYSEVSATGGATGATSVIKWLLITPIAILFAVLGEKLTRCRRRGISSRDS